MASKCYCNRCGNEIDGKSIHFYTTYLKELKKGKYTTIVFDLCENCCDFLVKKSEGLWKYDIVASDGDDAYEPVPF